jgi:drug/metabolite transporter (DMT)-like permease
VADLQLIVAAFIWGYVVYASKTGLTPDNMSSIVSMSGGALVANITSVILLVAETLMIRR